MITNITGIEMYDGFWPNVKTHYLSDNELQNYRLYEDLTSRFLSLIRRFLILRFSLALLGELCIIPILCLVLKIRLKTQKQFDTQYIRNLKETYLKNMDILGFYHGNP